MQAAAMAAVLAGALTAAPARAAEADFIVAPGATVVPDSYIVKLKDGVSNRTIAAKHGVRIGHSFDAALSGFSASMDARQARRVAADPAVEYVHADILGEGADVQTNPPNWGLDRIDNWKLPLDSEYMSPNTGTGVKIYIVDTGVRLTHNDFTGRISSVASFINDGRFGLDCNGHGTATAGVAAGTVHGVAKGARIMSVRAGNCANSFTSANVIAAINFVTSNAIKPAVLNLSLSFPASAAIDTAVNNAIGSGLTVVVAAGNQGVDACTRSPARVPNAITVGNSDRFDVRHTVAPLVSNFGSCLDLFAPGTDIRTTWFTSDVATSIRTGTSVSAPIVAGVAAQYLSLHQAAPATEVRDMLVAFASPDALTNIGAGSPNRLLSTSAVRSPSAFARFYLGLTPYFLVYKPSTGAVAIETPNSGALGTATTFSGRWTTGWTTIAPFVQDGEQRLLLYKAETGLVTIEKINAGGTGTTTLWSAEWTKGWTTIAPFYQDGQTRLLFYRAGSGKVYIDKVLSGGLGTTELWNGQWTAGWTTVLPFTQDGLAKVLLYKAGNGKVTIENVNAGGQGTALQWGQQWLTGWTAMSTYVHEGQTRLLCYRSSLGKVDIERILSGTQGTSLLWTNTWSTAPPWTALTPFYQENQVRLMSYKSGNGKIFTEAFNANAQGTTTLWEAEWTPGWT